MMKPVSLIALLFFAVAPLQAGQDVEVRDAWIRFLPGDSPMAGYAIVQNSGNQARRLVGASSDAFSMVQLHESYEENGTASMRPVDAVVVPAGGSAEFKPGGYHLMLMHRQRELAVNDEVPITLEFEDGASTTIRFPVKPAWQE